MPTIAEMKSDVAHLERAVDTHNINADSYINQNRHDLAEAEQDKAKDAKKRIEDLKKEIAKG
jgi:hypothetical protein